jgi:VWFA-related protein
MSTLSRRSLLGVLGLVPGSRILYAQTQNSLPPGFSTTVKVVNLLATVRDRQGQVVKDLTQDDFLLDEDGAPQIIRYFSRETDLPLTLGLLVDTSGSVRQVLPEERSASNRFLDKVMREDKDMAFVIHFDFEVELLADLTSAKSNLRKSLDQLETGHWQHAGYGGGVRGHGGHFGGGTALYDAVFLGADEIMRKQHGRKALIILSDGVDTGSKETLFGAIESAQRADTLVYSILFEDRDGFGSPRWSGGRMGERDGRKVLQRISGETGGHYFEASRRMPLEKVFEALEEELRTQYSIGYTPSAGAASREFRRIHLTTRHKGLVVQTRDGYYPA